jgi:hypothetical protein
MSEAFDFLSSQDSADAVADLNDRLFAELETNGTLDGIDDAAALIREAGLDVPVGGTLTIMHTTGVEPARPIPIECPDSGECVPTNCRWVKGQWICTWVCRCP